MKTQLLPLVALTFALAACDMGNTNVMIKTKSVTPPDVLSPQDNPDNPGPTLQCDFGFSYIGFGGVRLEADRDDLELGTDRDRVKPYEALLGEYARVLGSTPQLLTDLGNTFSSVPARWYVEPQATAVSLYSSMRVGFVGCLDYTAGDAYAVAPDPANAAAFCGQFATTFWSRSPDTDELEACKTVVLTGTADEMDNHRKWAYACASVLSSAPFLTF
jgi:hypothetical protein